MVAVAAVPRTAEAMEIVARVAAAAEAWAASLVALLQQAEPLTRVEVGAVTTAVALPAVAVPASLWCATPTESLLLHRPLASRQQAEQSPRTQAMVRMA